MLRKALGIAFVAVVVSLVSSSKVEAWGCYHAGYTHYSPYTGVHHYGYTAAYGRGGSAYHYGGTGYHYGTTGYHYGSTSAYHYGGYHYGGYHYGGASYGYHR